MAIEFIVLHQSFGNCRTHVVIAHCFSKLWSLYAFSVRVSDWSTELTGLTAASYWLIMAADNILSKVSSF